MNIVLSTISALSNPKESVRITLFLLARELQRQGHDVRIVAKGVGKEEMEGITVHRASLLRIPFLLRRLQKEKKIDIIHSFSASPLFFMPHLFAPGREVHTVKSYSRSRVGRIGYSLLRYADAVTVPTKVFALQLFGRKNIDVIYSPIDTTRFFPKDKQKLKKKYGYNNQKVVLYYGALWENKGVDILIDAIPHVVREIPNIKFLFLPRYMKIEAQQQHLQKLGMEKHVEFITHDVAIEDYVNLADVVVLPYRNLLGTEGNPSCLLEAMACKTAVVTTDLPELREIAYGSVLFAAPGDQVSLTENIIKSLSMPAAEKKEMLEKAYTKAQEFGHQKIAREFIQLYSSLLSKVSTIPGTNS